MTLTGILILSYILGMFATFMIVVGGTALWVAILDRRDAASARRAPAQAPAAVEVQALPLAA